MRPIVRLFAAGLCVAATASAVQAQVRRIQQVPNTGAPSASARAAQAAPNPAGLRPLFPAGISSGSGAAQSSDPIAASNSPVPAGGTTTTGSSGGRTTTVNPDGSTTTTTSGTAFGGSTTTSTTMTTNTANGMTLGTEGPLVNAGAAVMGAGAAVMGAGATVRGPAQTTAGGAGGFSATDVARSFYFADANHDGELSRAEAGRLSLRSLTFEEMDRNFDGIISRFEYDDSMR
jgi:hypothetical protein